jgi:hypothetical protein
VDFLSRLDRCRTALSPGAAHIAALFNRDMGVVELGVVELRWPG